ncbi:MAG: hypothetical protein LKK36_06295 [Ewingella americana]|jgi:uncharacterized protein (UPF0332 family)|uniref:hypothetical protein n=1 Tax=Ewingella americana TaxID=41202 RepID=UPI0024312696|nr:hypothetical protein [Ewingella americana]MCI1676643.1 hypothetical protein [Ewingella americana]MCI1853767.1 hypothetical protein [Ewingella americana]MCI1859992.1 hypothetical protein [Ewingella americana]MCI2142320.1 hypothetical protein [Ewingella americana]MCI2163283.1 hypothetical protein [Ewingella americana]
MPITHADFLDVARKSLDNSGEQWVRNSISRAYYCMFHTALQLSDGFIPEVDKSGSLLSGGTHKRFADYLCDGQAAATYSLDCVELKKIGLKLRTAHHRRVLADYKLTRKINKIDAISTMQDAEELGDKVIELLSVKKSVG